MDTREWIEEAFDFPLPLSPPRHDDVLSAVGDVVEQIRELGS